jgi:hypothetical protein
MTAGSPIISGRQRLRSALSERLLRMISGPTPAGSPMVRAMIGRVMLAAPFRGENVTISYWQDTAWVVRGQARKATR